MWQRAPSWVELDAAALCANAQKIKQEIGPHVQLAAVIKGNAYGFGIREISAILAQLPEVACAATFSATEALQAREAGFTKPLIVLGCVDVPYEVALAYDIDLVLHDARAALEYNREALSFGKQLAVHLKVDTGLTRLGMSPSEVLALCNQASELTGLHIRGIFSHFAESDSLDLSFTLRQAELFSQLLTQLRAKELCPPLVHMANTAAMFRLPQTHNQLVRCGGSLYGLRTAHMVGETRANDVQLVGSWKSRIVQLKNVQPGTTISYNRTFTAQKELLVATVPVGYADGYDRSLSNRGSVSVQGVACPIVGRVCMNMIMIDVSAVPQVVVGDEVMLLGDACGVRPVDIATLVGTVTYDITTRIRATLPRIIIKEHGYEKTTYTFDHYQFYSNSRS